MEYQEYISLGFKREDYHDEVEFRRTGYHGFLLSKKVNKKMSIEVWGSELDKPKLYIKKRNKDDQFHIILLTDEMVKDILYKQPKVQEYFNLA